MQSKIIKRNGKELTLEVKILLDPNSMLNSEQQWRQKTKPYERNMRILEARLGKIEVLLRQRME